MSSDAFRNAVSAHIKKTLVEYGAKNVESINESTDIFDIIDTPETMFAYFIMELEIDFEIEIVEFSYDDAPKYVGAVVDKIVEIQRFCRNK